MLLETVQQLMFFTKPMFVQVFDLDETESRVSKQLLSFHSSTQPVFLSLSRRLEVAISRFQSDHSISL